MSEFQDAKEGKSGSTARRSMRFNVGRENSAHDLKLIGTSVARSVNANAKQLKRQTNKTFQAVRTTLDNISQKLRRSTRRRYRLEATAATPKRNSNDDENRPVKLYSPFGIETPSKMKSSLHAKRRSNPGPNFRSPSQRLREDVMSLQTSNRQLASLAGAMGVRVSIKF